jgi:hypothetical protein
LFNQQAANQHTINTIAIMTDEASTSSKYNPLSLSEQLEGFHDEPEVDDQDEEEPAIIGLGSEDGYDESTRIETEAEHVSRTLATQSRTSALWNACLLPDDRFSIAGVSLVDGPAAVKLLKFVIVTLGSICLMYKGIRFVVRACVTAVDAQRRRRVPLEREGAGWNPFQLYLSSLTYSNILI